MEHGGGTADNETEGNSVISESEIGKLILGQGDGEDPEVQSQHEELTNDAIKPEDWSDLNGTIYMYNKETLRPHAGVYRGKQKQGSGVMQDVVVKILKETENSSQEADVLLNLGEHENVVKIIDSGKIVGVVPQLYIVMELCGSNITEYINENPFELAVATVFFLQTVSAILFIHDNNIVHRDLKPSNILVSVDRKNIKVSNFGITKDTEDHDESQVTDTDADGFKAPEIYLDKQEVDFKVDVYSLAICGYVIMTHGKHPFGTDSSKWVANITGNKHRDLSHLPKFPKQNSRKRSQLAELFKRMLERNPKDRPTAQQVRDDVFFKDDQQGDADTGILSAFRRYLAERNWDKTRTKLAKQSLDLLRRSKYLEAAKVLRQLFDSEGSDKLKHAIQIVECDMNLESEEVEDSIQRLRDSIPESYTADDVVNLSRDLAQDCRFIGALILLRVATEMHQDVEQTPDDKVTWIGNIVYDIFNPTQQLIMSYGTSRDIALNYGLKYICQLLDDLRSVTDATADVKAVQEARCLNNICAIKCAIAEYESTISLGQEAVACLENQLGENANKCRYYGLSLFNIGLAHNKLSQYSEAEQYYIRALEAHESADYETENKGKDINRTNTNLSAVLQELGKK